MSLVIFLSTGDWIERNAEVGKKLRDLMLVFNVAFLHPGCQYNSFLWDAESCQWDHCDEWFLLCVALNLG